MIKIKIVKDVGYSFWCPGCQRDHVYYVPQWNFNGNIDRPSFTPSLLNYIPEHKDELGSIVPRKTICHLYLTDGVIHYCADSIHQLAGKSIDINERDQKTVHRENK